jgi:leucyl aminopeptidase
MTLKSLTLEKHVHSIPVHVVTVANYPAWLEQQVPFIKTWLQASQFKAEPGMMRLLPDAAGKVEAVVVMVASDTHFWGVGQCALVLPEGDYHLVNASADHALAWGLGAYQFTRYKKATREPARLHCDLPDVLNQVESIYLVRDLINTPTEDMLPSDLAFEAKQLAQDCNAKYHEIIGDDLLKQNYPAIHAVGRASADAPRLIDIRWGDASHPKITLVGKGVCFDSGGLDIKSASNMLLMKKDMGGAANVLGLARMIMKANLKVCLRVLIPAVENAIAGNAYRPGDVIKTRKGLTVEIGNTDAEGRVILADALAEAASEKPALIIDMATLTGAARVALGTELPALFSNDLTTAQSTLQSCVKVQDEMWHMPLFAAYRESINSSIADLTNSPAEAYGGAITAALFLNAFVPETIPWMHIDLMAWNLRARPGRPQGGEAMGVRGLYRYLADCFGFLKI